MKKSILWVIGSILIVTAGLFVWKSGMVRELEGVFSETSKADSVIKPVATLYGLAVDSFALENGEVGKDQNLGEILQQYTLPERALAQLLTYGNEAFDVRKIRRGNRYSAFLSKDSVPVLRYFVYEHTPIDYVVFDFTDSVKISLCQKEVITRQKVATGEIKTSLWDAITNDSINPQVAIELSEIYAWTVDFFGLQQGDRFTVAYDELYVDSVSVGLGQIHGASFRFGGRDIMAIPFQQDSVLSYFDQDGNSLKRAFLKAPLRFSRISSHFSGSRMHPVLKIRRPHYGVDYAAPTGTPVYSIGDGRVLQVAYQSGGGGRYVKIRHNSVYTTTYMHLSAYAKGLHGGQMVRQGELIGYVGSSGLSSGPHLDFRVFRNGSPIDPLKMESPPVSPVKPENLQAFSQIKAETMDILQGVQGNELGRVEQKPDMTEGSLGN